MKLPAIVDSAFVIAVCSGALYLVGFAHDSAELNALGLPTSFVYAPETLLLKGFSTVVRYAMFAVPAFALGWVVLGLLARYLPLPSVFQQPLTDIAQFIKAQRIWLIAIAVILAATLLFDLASSQGKEDALELVRARIERTTEVRFKDGAQMIATPFRSDDMFMVLVTRSLSSSGQMQVLVR